MLIFMLVATMVVELAASNPATLTETVIKVEPALVEFGNPAGDPIPIPGTQFTVTIKIYNVTNLYGFDLKFRWNTTYLDYVNHSVRVPKDTYPDGVLWNPIIPIMDEVNTTAGTYWIAYTSRYPAPSFNGTGTVFNMTFKIIKQPYDWETGGPGIDPIDTQLDFISTDLAMFGGDPILHHVEPATVRIWEKTVPAISVINPLTGNNNFTFHTNTTPVGSRFNATIWVYDVANLFAYQVCLYYNSTLLNATRAWLPTWNPAWVFYGKTTIGLPPTFKADYVQIGDSIMGTYPTFSGKGILCIIEFEIIYTPATGEISCNLNVNNTDTLLLDSNGNEILSIKTNGHYIYVYEKLSSTISITISPSTMNFGENTTISGVISPPRSANVTLLYRPQGEAEWENLTIAPTNLEGRYSYTWTPPKAGDYTIRASWPGDENTNPAQNETQLTVAKLNSTVTISVSPEKITLGSSVIINVTLIPVKPNANITIEYQLEGQTTWTFITTKSTDNNGNFSHIWTPSKAGNYTIRASWPGDQNTHQAESEHKTVKVEAQPTEMVLYIVTGIITVAIIVAVAIYLVKIRKPHK
jgi:hypothetical protein